jgi:hypothetical protein
MTKRTWLIIGGLALVWVGWEIAKRRKFTVTIPEDEIKIKFNVKGKTPPGSFGKK